VRQNVRYQNDEPGKEQLRRPQRTLYDKTGDCDDMSILISCILTNLGYKHELYVAAYSKENEWQHIYPVAYSNDGSRYVIDCVPEIPYFNYEAKPIKNKIILNMRLEELGSVPSDMISELTQEFDIDNLSGVYSEEDETVTIQGLLGNVAIVDQYDDYDTVLSGSELQRNIILKQLTDAKQALEKEVNSPTDMSQLNDNRADLRLVTEIINNYDNEEGCNEAISDAINRQTLYQNFYKAVQFGLNEAMKGLSGEAEDDMYYLKIMGENGMLEELVSDQYSTEDMEGLAALKLFNKKTTPKSGGLLKKIGTKVKQGVKKFKENNPKIAKVGHALNKYNPATFTLRKSMEAFLMANVFFVGEKLSIGYATEAEAKKLGYSNAEWKQFVDAKNKAEQKWHSLGGDKAYFKKMVLNSRGAKKAGLKGELGIAPAVIAAVTKVFGGIIDIVKKLKLRKRDGSIVDETKETPSGSDTDTGTDTKTKTKSMDAGEKENLQYKDSGSEADNANIETDEKTGLSVETVTGEDGKETKVYRDKDGNEISRIKYFLTKNKTMVIIVAVVITIGIAGLIIRKIRQRSLRGLGEAGLSKKQENFIKRQGLNNKAYASLIREEIRKDKKPYDNSNRKKYYKKIFREAFNKPLSPKQVSAAHNYNSMQKQVRELAKAKGGGSRAWKAAWAEVKKKRIAEPELNFSGMKRKNTSKRHLKPVKYRGVAGKAKNTEVSDRFKKITGRAKKTRQRHPKMKWKNCIRQASQELYG